MSSTAELQRITTSGDNDEYVHIGNNKYLRSELLGAFGGEFRTGIALAPTRKLGNPVPMGLAGFSISVLLLSMMNVRVRSVTNPAIVFPVCYFGGLIQFLAGMWGLALENTFAAQALGSYGAFWFSYAIINTGAFGVTKGYSAEDLNQAIAMLLWCWCIFSFLLTLATIRSTWPFFSLIFSVFLTFLMLACSYTVGNDNLTLAGGWIGIVAGILGFYNTMAGIANYENCYFDVPPLFMPTAEKPPSKHHSD